MVNITDTVAQIMEWTKLKCRLQAESAKILYAKERDVWWASIGANIGSEQNGKHELFERPVLVVKRLYGGDLLWVVPITSSNKRGDYYYQIEHEGKEYTLVLSQMRPISRKRLIRKHRVVPEMEFKEIQRQLQSLMI